MPPQSTLGRRRDSAGKPRRRERNTWRPPRLQIHIYHGFFLFALIIARPETGRYRVSPDVAGSRPLEHLSTCNCLTLVCCLQSIGLGGGAASLGGEPGSWRGWSLAHKRSPPQSGLAGRIAGPTLREVVKWDRRLVRAGPPGTDRGRTGTGHNARPHSMETAGSPARGEIHRPFRRRGPARDRSNLPG